MKYLVLVTACLALLLVGILLSSRRQQTQTTVPISQEASAAPDASVQLVDPKTVLFSLPTLCDKLPPTSGHVGEAPPGTFKLHEDDWRQVEFVSAADRSLVEQELAELVQFKTANRVGAGWKNVYVRTSRSTAIASDQISLRQVLQLAGKDAKPTPLLLDSAGTRSAVTGGFAVPMGKGAMLYGYADADHVISLNIHFSDADIPSDSVRLLLSRICQQFHLILVDWYRAAIVLP